MNVPYDKYLSIHSLIDLDAAQKTLWHYVPPLLPILLPTLCLILLHYLIPNWQVILLHKFLNVKMQACGQTMHQIYMIGNTKPNGQITCTNGKHWSSKPEFSKLIFTGIKSRGILGHNKGLCYMYSSRVQV